MSPASVIFISWGGHRRSSEIGRQFGVEVLTFRTPYRGLRRYLVLGWRTLYTLLVRRPRTVIVQSPSFMLSALAEVLAPVLRFRIVIDAHNEAITPFIYNYALVRWGARVLLRRADLVIVSNSRLREYVERLGTRAVVLPDPIPSAPPGDKMALGPGAHVVFICTFASDEPVEDVMEAAKILGPTVTIHVTGAPNARGEAARKNAPPNVRFCGYLEEGLYWRLLASADVIMDLTLIPACLVCGAYEALAIGRPLVLFDDPAAREAFTTAAEYAGHGPDSIANALGRVLAQREAFAVSVASARILFERHWSAAARRFADELDLCAPQSALHDELTKEGESSDVRVP
jgi:glycosyltransferase involved in cell wall biosynthesis